MITRRPVKCCTLLYVYNNSHAIYINLIMPKLLCRLPAGFIIYKELSLNYSVVTSEAIRIDNWFTQLQQCVCMTATTL